MQWFQQFSRSICSHWWHRIHLALYKLKICISFCLQLLAKGTQQWTKVLQSISNRKKSMVGSVAISAGFATYLGVYHYSFRRNMIQNVWPECLKERGIVIDLNIGSSLTIDISMSTVASQDSPTVIEEKEKRKDDSELQGTTSVESEKVFCWYFDFFIVFRFSLKCRELSQ